MFPLTGDGTMEYKLPTIVMLIVRKVGKATSSLLPGRLSKMKNINFTPNGYKQKLIYHRKLLFGDDS